MDPDTPLDYALFQLSPRRSRCELVVSGNGRTEKIASGFVKPFVAHLRAAEEQAAAQPSAPAIRLQVDRRANGCAWFSKGTLERFVRFVSTPEVLELANTFDAEMSQLEGARKIYAQGVGDSAAGSTAGNEATSAAAADITKKELLRAIDVRLSALKQDLVTACARASSAGFNPDNVSELLFFADHFGANRLSEACTKFMSLCQRRPDLISHQHSLPALSSQWKGFDDGNIRSSSGSDMSIDEPEVELAGPNKKIQGSGGNSQIHRLSNSQHSGEDPAEAIMEQRPKLTMQRTIEKQEKEKNAAPLPAVSDQPAGGGSRRLSVQDRINLFESKQKEQTSSSNNSNSAGTSRVVTSKGEHRRVPSNTSMEKLVLRRWSGASDMSIDLSNNDSSSVNDRKENVSSAGTPTSANLEGHAKVRAEEEASGLKDTATPRSSLCQNENPNDSCLASTTRNTSSSLTSANSTSSSSAAAIAPPITQTSSEDNTAIASSIQSESSFKKEQGVNQAHSSMGKLEHNGASANAAAQTRIKASPKLLEDASVKEKASFPTSLPEKHVRMKDQETSAVSYHDIPVASEQIGQRDPRGSRPQPVERYGAADCVRVKNQPNRMFGKKSGDVDMKSKVFSESRIGPLSSSDEVATMETEVQTVVSQQKNLPRKAEGIGGKAVVASDMPSLSFPVKMKEDGSCRKGNLSRQSSTEQELNLRGGKNKLVNEGNGAPMLLEKKVKEFARISDPLKGPPSEQVKVTRLSKGNQDRNDELQMKANELEKLFAAHKLRVQNDQMTSTRRGKSTDEQVDDVPKAGEIKPASVVPDQFPPKRFVKESAPDDFDASLLLKMVDNQEYNNSVQQKLGILSIEESRGKFYEQYMQKRDAKLREEWKLQREQKEAIMRAMHDSLERSQAEMQAKFSRSANVQDSTYVSHSAKKTQPSSYAALKEKDQGVESLVGEEEMNSDYLSGDGSYRSTESRKHFSSKISSTPRPSVVPIPKPSVRTAKSGSANQRTTLENPLAQSVPNFSDFRKENTKPSTGISRATTRVQAKSFARSKSITDETNSLLKEDKSRRSQSMRKSSTGPGELKDISSLNDDIFNWDPSRISKDQTERTFTYNAQKSGVPKSFLRKGNGVRPIGGVAGLPASMISDVFQNGEEPEGFMDQQEDSPDDVKEEEEYESIEENFRESDFPADSDSENPGLGHEFGNSDDPSSENGDISQSGEAAVIAAPKLNAFTGNIPELSGELPAPWNSNFQHLFPYANESSDVDAFVDSPTGSPSPWNSHPLDQTVDADVARMRKKWGSAQMPILGTNPAQQSRKDVTKGFKKLLKFGRKNRGVDGLANDWVSASTASECDDDMEDGRDLTVGPSDDLRKSRMGSLSSYDGFVENDIFAEQAQSLRSSIPNPPANFRLREDHMTGSSLKAPRSFFSLSTFRSKGADARLR